MPQAQQVPFDFSARAPYRRGSDTSRQAAEEIKPKSSTLRGIVYGFLVARGAQGATDEEIQDGLAMNPSTERPRRIELIDAGLAQDSGTTRKTRAGRSATVWTAVQNG